MRSLRARTAPARAAPARDGRRIVSLARARDDGRRRGARAREEADEDVSTGDDVVESLRKRALALGLCALAASVSAASTAVASVDRGWGPGVDRGDAERAFGWGDDESGADRDGDAEASGREKTFRAFVSPELRGDGAGWAPAPRRALARDGGYRTIQSSQRLTEDERETVNLFNNAKRSVVYITNVAVRRDAFTLDLTEAPQGAGSGVVWDDAGHIVTNFHVIDRANQLKVSFLPKKGASRLQGQKVYDAAIVGFDEDKDIAVLQVTDPEALQEMKPLSIGRSGEALVGQRVYAIGNPFGLDHTLTTGIISGLGREIQSGNTGRPIDGIIQTDAAINPGNSGGPLLNSSGQLIGINTAIYSASGTSSGVGFALPSDMVSGIVDQIIRFGRVTRPILGVSFAPDGALDQLGLGGVLVLDARPGGPADRAGVHSTTRDDTGRLILGDIIIELAGEPIEGSSDLYRTLDKLRVGDVVELKLLRGADKITTQIELDDIKDMKPPRESTVVIPMRPRNNSMPF